MHHYDQLRHFADSWALLALTVIFAGVIFWVLRPGAGRSYREQAEIPFKHDDEGMRDG